MEARITITLRCSDNNKEGVNFIKDAKDSIQNAYLQQDCKDCGVKCTATFEYLENNGKV